MKGTRFIKGVAKSALNVPAWLGWDALVEQTRYLVGVIKNFFALNPPVTDEPPENFTQAAERLNLNEQDLEVRARQNLIMALIYFVSALLILAYGIWHLFNEGYIATAMTIAIFIYLLAQAFSNHFWYFQIKHRRLGCTFSDWFKGTFTGG